MRTSDKRCPYCGRTLEWWQFNRSKAAPDGLQAYCKDCQRRYKEKHPTKEYKQHRETNGILKLWD